MKLFGRRAVITGANQGFGLAVAKKFVTEGSSVMLCGRNAELLYEAQQTLQKIAKEQVKVYAQVTDVSSISAVNELIQSSIENMGGIDVLISNAGVYGTKGAIEVVDWDEWSDAIDINLKGTVLVSRAVIPYFKKHGSGKIIILSGGGATKPLPFLSAYAASKAGVVRFGETIAEELKDFNVDVNMIAPGALNTRLLDEILAAGPEKVGQPFYDNAVKQKQQGGASLELGASLCLYLASPISNGITGKLISAVWDPWQDLHNYIDELKDSDIYTLRRIIPKERGKSWGDVK